MQYWSLLWVELTYLFLQILGVTERSLALNYLSVMGGNQKYLHSSISFKSGMYELVNAGEVGSDKSWAICHSTCGPTWNLENQPTPQFIHELFKSLDNSKGSTSCTLGGYRLHGPWIITLFFFKCRRLHPWDPSPPQVGKRLQLCTPFPPKSCGRTLWTAPNLMIILAFFFAIQLFCELWLQMFSTNQRPKNAPLQPKALWNKTMPLFCLRKKKICGWRF